MNLSDRLEALTPLLARSLFNIPIASWLLAFAAVLASYLGMQLLLSYIRRSLSKLGKQGKQQQIDGTGSNAYQLRDMLLEVLSDTSKLALVLTALLIGVTLLDLPAYWGDRVHNLWFLAFGLQLVIWLNRTVHLFARRYFLSISPQGESGATVSQTLTVWAAQTLLWVVFFLAMLANVGVNITAFVASLGIGGIALALAAQNILVDLFASLAIAVDKPFEVGDAINVDTKSGTVEHVGLKTTRIRADSGEQIVIANSVLLQKIILNYKRMQTRRVEFEMIIAFGNPPELTEKIPAVIERIVGDHADVRFDRAHFKSFTPDKIVFDIVYSVLRPDYKLYMDVQQAINIALLKELGSLGVVFSAPSQVFQLVDDRALQRITPALSAEKST